MSEAKDVTGEGASPVDGELAPGAVIAGKYVIEHLLGEGGMGSVWSAHHLQTNRPVAIKALRDFGGKAATERARQRLLREARAAGSIRHPNVVDVYDVLDSTEGPLLVMERLEGEALHTLMGRGPVPPADALRLLMPAMRGVAAAHEQGVVHRDLKPDNIFLLRDDRSRLVGVKVLDFGISKVAGDPLDNKLTQSGTILGTPAYMAPEQLTAGAVDARTDVYALGAIVYEAVSGVLPHAGETFAVMATEKLGRDPVSLRKRAANVPRGFAKAIERALSRNPDSRYSSIAAFAEALEPYTDVGFGGAMVELVSETGRRPTVAPTSQRGTWVAIAIAGALVAALTGTAAVWFLGSAGTEGTDGAGGVHGTSPVLEDEAPLEPAATGPQTAAGDGPNPTDEASGAAAGDVVGPEEAAPEETATDPGIAAAGDTPEPTEVQEPAAGDGRPHPRSMRRTMRRAMRAGRGRSGSIGISDF